MAISPLAGKPAPMEMLVDVARLVLGKDIGGQDSRLQRRQHLGQTPAVAAETHDPDCRVVQVTSRPPNELFRLLLPKEHA